MVGVHTLKEKNKSSFLTYSQLLPEKELAAWQEHAILGCWPEVAKRRFSLATSVSDGGWSPHTQGKEKSPASTDRIMIPCDYLLTARNGFTTGFMTAKYRSMPNYVASGILMRTAT